MKRDSIVFLLVLFATGCSSCFYSLAEDATRQTSQASQLCLRIISKPAGVNVDVDGYYAGKTPIVWIAPKDKYSYKPIVVVAHPVLVGKQPQKRILRSSEEMPQVVYFDMLQPR